MAVCNKKMFCERIFFTLAATKTSKVNNVATFFKTTTALIVFNVPKGM